MTNIFLIYQVIGVLNVLILAGISIWTFRRYVTIRSRFTLAMVLFSWLLLLNSVVACPAFLAACGVECSTASLPFYTLASAVQFGAMLFLAYILVE